MLILKISKNRFKLTLDHGHDHGHDQGTVTVTLFTKCHGTVRSGTVRYEKFTFTRQERNFHCNNF